MSGFLPQSLRVEPACGSRTWTNTGSQYAGAVSKFIYFRDSNDAVFYEDKKIWHGFDYLIVYGVLLALAGVGIYTLVLGIVFALIAELLLRLGKYQKPNLAILAFAIASIGANGNVLSMVLASTEYLEGKAATYGSEYMQLMQSYFSEWWVLPLLALSAFLGGLLGGLLGKSVFKNILSGAGYFNEMKSILYDTKPTIRQMYLDPRTKILLCVTVSFVMIASDNTGVMRYVLPCMALIPLAAFIILKKYAIAAYYAVLYMISIILPDYAMEHFPAIVNIPFYRNYSNIYKNIAGYVDV